MRVPLPLRREAAASVDRIASNLYFALWKALFRIAQVWLHAKSVRINALVEVGIGAW